jgi:hypothetical protein
VSNRPALVIGIDPGINGAIGTLAHSEKGPVFVRVDSMPTEEKQSGRRQIDAGALRDLFAELWGISGKHHRGGMLFLIERVSAMPGQGTSGMFSLGDSFGVARAIACSFGEVSFVAPQKWKGELGLTLSKEERDRLGKNKAAQASKAAALTMARRRYKDARPFLFRKKDEGRAEAILIAHYARTHLRW